MTQSGLMETSIEKANVWLHEVANELGAEAAFACSACSRVLRRHVSEGELDDVTAVLPAGLKEVVAG